METKTLCIGLKSKKPEKVGASCPGRRFFSSLALTFAPIRVYLCSSVDSLFLFYHLYPLRFSLVAHKPQGFFPALLQGCAPCAILSYWKPIEEPRHPRLMDLGAYRAVKIHT